MYRLRPGLRGFIGVPYAATQEESELRTESGTICNEMNDEPLWLERNRSISLENQKACDEIMRQFLRIEIDKNMIINDDGCYGSLNHEPSQVQSGDDESGYGLIYSDLL